MSVSKVTCSFRFRAPFCWSSCRQMERKSQGNEASVLSPLWLTLEEAELYRLLIRVEERRGGGRLLDSSMLSSLP
ncbi:uncharacterized [Tachysurus ichikawai]